MSKKISILGMGNPLLDVSAVVPEKMIKKYNCVFGNAVMATEKQLPVYNDLINNYKVTYIAGGSTQNSMRVFSWASGGESACFLGCIGKDSYGEKLAKTAKESGLLAKYQIDEKTSTGTCAVLVFGKERSLIANLAAANKYTIDHLKQNENLMKSAENFYIAGYFLTVSPDSMEYVAKHAVKENKPFMVNLAATFIPQYFKDRLLSILPYTDVLFGNEEEALAFGLAMGWETKDLETIGKKIVEMEKTNKKRERIVVFTQGKKPVMVIEKKKTTKIKVPLVKMENIVDLNGAGDAFCGGFLSQFVKGKSLEICSKAGIYASSVIIQQNGCTFPVDKKFEF